MTPLLLACLRNALWQLPLLLAIALLAARVLRPLGPHVVHRLWILTLTLEALLPALSLIPRPTALALRWFHPQAVTHASITTTLGPVFGLGSGVTAHIHTALLAAWAALTLAFAIRLLRSLLTLHRLRPSVEPASALSPQLTTLWGQITSAAGLVPSPNLALSAHVTSPLAFGLRRPIVLLPLDLPSSLDQADLRAVLAHECAHLRHHDFAINLALQLLTLPFHLHPALHLTRRRLVEARECARDAEAARSTPSSRAYAASLLRVAALLLSPPSTPNPIPATLTVGLLTRNTLERRIMVLAHAPSAPSSLRRTALLALAATLTLGSAAASLAFASPAPEPLPNSTSASTTSKPLHVDSGVMAGQSRNKVPPIYPPAAKAAKIEGAVRLSATISPSGTVERLRVLSGPEELRAATLEAVRQWTYQPFLRNGNPIAVQTTITVNYHLAP